MGVQKIWTESPNTTWQHYILTCIYTWFVKASILQVTYEATIKLFSTPVVWRNKLTQFGIINLSKQFIWRKKWHQLVIQQIKVLVRSCTPHRWLVLDWSPRHLLAPATWTAPETEIRGVWPPPFHDDHMRSSWRTCQERKTYQFLLRTRHCPPFPPARAPAGRTTEALQRSLAPNVDVAGRAGETHTAPGTTAAFCSPSDLF